MTLVRSSGTHQAAQSNVTIFDGTENAGRGFYATYLNLSAIANSDTILQIRVYDDTRSLYFFTVGGRQVDTTYNIASTFFIPFVPSDSYDVRIRNYDASGTISVPWVLYKQPQV